MFCPFSVFFLAIGMSVLRFTAPNYPFDIFKYLIEKLQIGLHGYHRYKINYISKNIASYLSFFIVLESINMTFTYWHIFFIMYQRNGNCEFYFKIQIIKTHENDLFNLIKVFSYFAQFKIINCSSVKTCFNWLFQSTIMFQSH